MTRRGHAGTPAVRFCQRIIWSYNYADAEKHHHHDLAPLPNGNFLVLAWELRTEEEAIQAGRLNPKTSFVHI